MEAEFLGHDAELRVDRVVPTQVLARIGEHAAEDGRHRALGAVASPRCTACSRGWRRTGRRVPPDTDLYRAACDASFATVRVGCRSSSTSQSLRAEGVLRHAVPATADVAALAEHFRAVGVFELDAVMIEDLAVVWSPCRPAQPPMPLPSHGQPAFQPIADVEIVNVLLDDMIAAEPDEVIPVAHLVFHFASDRLVSLLLIAGVLPGRSPFQ